MVKVYFNNGAQDWKPSHRLLTIFFAKKFARIFTDLSVFLSGYTKTSNAPRCDPLLPFVRRFHL